MVARSQVLGLVLGVALTGGMAACGSDDAAPPVIDGTTAATGSSTPTGSIPTTTTAATSFDDKGGDLLVGTIHAHGAEERAVANAWIAYWKTRVPMYYKAKLDAAALGRVARGSAVTSVVTRVQTLRQKGWHSEGDGRVGVSRVTVRGNYASVVSCIENKSRDSDAQGRPQEKLIPYYNFVGALQKVDGHWLVIAEHDTGSKPCRA